MATFHPEAQKLNQLHERRAISLWQIAATHEKVSKLEQAKEHWILESQLLQVKYEKEVKVCFH